jgi:flagellar motor switch protein FliM
MSEQVLTQEEIDALLAGISESDAEAAPIQEAKEAIELDTTFSSAARYDFAKHGAIKKENLPALEFIYNRFEKSFRSALSLIIEKGIEVEMSFLKNMKYEEFISTLPLPTNMNVVVTENLNGFFIVIFDAKTIFSVLETIFGGSRVSHPGRVDGREFTKIEIGVIKKLIGIVSAEMEKAWAPVYEIRCRYSRSEMNPNYITMISRDEVVNICEYQLEIGDAQGWMKVCVPYSILENIKGRLTTTPSREDAEMREKWFKLLVERAHQTPLELRAVLGRSKLSFGECRELAPGSVIFLDRHINDLIDIEVEGKLKFKGRVGALKGNKAIRFEEVTERRE